MFRIVSMVRIFHRCIVLLALLTMSKQVEFEVAEEVSESTDQKESDGPETKEDSISILIGKSDLATVTEEEISGKEDNIKPADGTESSLEVVENQHVLMTQNETNDEISEEDKEVDNETKSTEKAELDLSVHSETHIASNEKDDSKTFQIGTTLISTVDNADDISKSVVDLMGGSRVARFNRPVADILQQGKNIVDVLNGRIIQDIEQIRQFLTKQIFLRN